MQGHIMLLQGHAPAADTVLYQCLYNSPMHALILFHPCTDACVCTGASVLLQGHPGAAASLHTLCDREAVAGPPPQGACAYSSPLAPEPGSS